MQNENQLALFDVPTLEQLRKLFDYPPNEGTVVGHCNFENHGPMHDLEMVCDKCGGPLTCGPFSHACKVCDPFEFQRCGICNQPRVFCCC